MDQTKPNMSEEERLALAKKLDDELEQYIQSLEKRQYNEGWPEDRWEEEMDKHPFFMKQAPQPGDELSPLMEGLQKLKYDPMENSPEELANSYKEDGNFNFKHKNYRLAIMSYTEGIKAKCHNDELNATLYNNRSAAHFFLDNFRSSLRDCEKALKLNEKYLKTLVRAALCCFKLRDYERSVVYCDAVLLVDPKHQEMATLRKKALDAKKTFERDIRKRERLSKKLNEQERQLINEIKARGVRIADCKDSDISTLELSFLEPTVPQLTDFKVHLDPKSNALIWPVMFMYPEYKLTDFVQEFNENSTFIDILSEMFSQPAEWDVEKKYRLDNVNVYFESLDVKVVAVDVNVRLRDVLRNARFIVKAGTPCFIVLPKNSKVEEQFLKSY